MFLVVAYKVILLLLFISYSRRLIRSFIPAKRGIYGLAFGSAIRECGTSSAQSTSSG